MQTKHETRPPSGYVTPEEAAEYLAVSPRTLRRMAAEGKVRAHRLGPRLVRYARADLDAALTPIPTVGGGAR